MAANPIVIVGMGVQRNVQDLERADTVQAADCREISHRHQNCGISSKRKSQPSPTFQLADLISTNGIILIQNAKAASCLEEAISSAMVTATGTLILRSLGYIPWKQRLWTLSSANSSKSSMRLSSPLVLHSTRCLDLKQRAMLVLSHTTSTECYRKIPRKSSLTRTLAVT